MNPAGATGAAPRLPQVWRLWWCVLTIAPAGVGFIHGVSLPLLLSLGWYGMGLVAARSAGRQLAKGVCPRLLVRLLCAPLSLGVVLMLLLFGLWVRSDFICVVPLCGMVGVTLLTARSHTPAEFRVRALSLGVALGGASIPLIIGEVVMRTPAVASRWANPWSDADYDRLWERNPYHLRSLRTDRHKAPGAFRIVTLGDSYSWGAKIAHTEAVWPAVLEAKLRSTDPTVEVVNFGQNGYTTVNEVELLEELGWQFAPDLVLLQFTVNDPLPSRPGRISAGEDWLFPMLPLAVFQDFDLLLRSVSRGYEFADARFRSVQLSYRFPAGHQSLFEENFAGWKDCQRALGRLAVETRRRKVRAAVVVFPFFLPDLKLPGYRYQVIHERVRAAAAAVGLPVLDLRPYFEARPGAEWQVFPGYDAHPSPAAHRVAAQAIAPWLAQNGLLTPTKEPARKQPSQRETKQHTPQGD